MVARTETALAWFCREKRRVGRKRCADGCDRCRILAARLSCPLKAALRQPYDAAGITWLCFRRMWHPHDEALRLRDHPQKRGILCREGCGDKLPLCADAERPA